MARVEIDPKKCVHCQDCIGVCPIGVYRFLNKRVQVVDAKSCLGTSCQMCADTCWRMAISVSRQTRETSPGDTHDQVE